MKITDWLKFGFLYCLLCGPAQASASTPVSLFQKARDTLLYDIDAFCDFVNQGNALVESSSIIIKRQGLAYRALCLCYNDQFEESDHLADSIIQYKEKDALSLVYAYAAKGGNAQFQNNYEQAIEFYLTALEVAESSNLLLEQGMINNAISFVFYELEYFEKTIEYALEVEKVGLALGNRALLANSWMRLHSSYAGDEPEEHIRLANLYKMKFDSLAQVMDSPSMKMSSAIDQGWLKLDEGQLDSAEIYYLVGLKYAREFEDSVNMSYCLGNLGKIYIMQNEGAKADKVFKEIKYLLYAKIDETNKLFLLRMLSQFEETKGEYKAALEYLDEFVERDEIFYDDVTRNEILDYEAKYEHLNQQNEIEKQSLQLKQRTTQRNLAFTGGALILALSFLGFNIWRNISLKKAFDQDQMLLQTENELVESRMQMMRAQMNPHFLFNSLNSIKHFILQKSKDESAQYISDFAKLMRMNLQNSAEVLIPLDKEIAFLKQYLLMEQMRFKQPFEVVWDIEKNIDLEAFRFPPMLIQPYIENAIWHGLRYKKEGGAIQIHLSTINEDNLVCIVQDNGVGRQKSGEIRASSLSLKRSMGMQITEDRISMTNTILDANIRVHIEDLYSTDHQATGTRVTIYIPYLNDQRN